MTTDVYETIERVIGNGADLFHGTTIIILDTVSRSALGDVLSTYPPLDYLYGSIDDESRSNELISYINGTDNDVAVLDRRVPIEDGDGHRSRVAGGRRANLTLFESGRTNVGGRGVGGGSGNGITGDDDAYLSTSRFGFETAVSLAAVLPNVLIAIVIRRISCGGRLRVRPMSVYNILFANLAIANCLSTVLLWLCNNLLYLFNDRLSRTFQTRPCLFFVHVSSPVFTSMSFGIVTTLIMLGFSTVQYSAICRPLHHRSVLSRRKIIIFLVVVWITSLLVGSVPTGYLWGLVRRGRTCGLYRLHRIGLIVRRGANASAAILSVIHLTIFIQCALIFRRMFIVRREMSPFRYARDMRTERRAIVTIVILLLTLNVFFVPYTVMTLLTLNWSTDAHTQNSALVYYMNLLPHIKCMVDPLVYGLRMREMQNCRIRLQKLIGGRPHPGPVAAAASSDRCRTCRSSRFEVALIGEAAVVIGTVAVGALEQPLVCPRTAMDAENDEVALSAISLNRARETDDVDIDSSERDAIAVISV